MYYTTDFGLTYHTFSQCTLQKGLMTDKCVKSMFLKSIKETQETLNFDLVAYVILDNHFHLIIKTKKNEASISRIMKDIKYKFTRKYNGKFNTQGTTWSKRYGKTIIEESIDPDRYFKWLIAYLAFNPVRKNAVVDPRKYSFSSINTFFIPGFTPELKITPHEIFLSSGVDLNERIKEFLKFEEIYKETLFLQGRV